MIDKRARGPQMSAIRRGVRILTVVLLPVAIVSLGAEGADASDPGNDTGGSVAQPGEVLANQDTVRQASAKVALAEAYVAAKEGRLSAKDYRAKVKAVRDEFGPNSEPDPSLMAKQPNGITPPSGPVLVDSNPQVATTASAAAAAATWSRVLGMGIYGQINGYYCGPASAYMVARYKAIFTGKYAGGSLSQPTLANNSYLRTDLYGVTDWSRDQFRTGLNRWMYGANTGFYISAHAPSTSYMQTAVVTDIDKSMPFGASTVEYAGGIHFNGHPNRLIGHWIVTYGYNYEGRATQFADPAFSLSEYAANGTQPSFAYNTSSFTNAFLQNNGITW